MIDPSLLERARAWRSGDPDERDRGELGSLIERAERGDESAGVDLLDRFQGPLKFGTAGLRGLIGAGETRMNRAVVRRATYGLVQYVLATIPGAKQRGIVIGRDARDRSDELQKEAAGVAAALGVRVFLLPGTSPTPLVAFSVKELGAAAGVQVTASHNPPRYNGYKVYWDNGAQIIPPHDRGIAAEIAAAPPANAILVLALEECSGLVIEEREVEARYLDAVSKLHTLRDLPADRLSIAYTALHGVGERLTREVMSRLGYTKLTSVREQAEPDGRFPTVSFPNPEEPEALERVLALAKREDADLVLAQDPDADRLAVAARRADREYVVLSGNEIGVLLAHHLLTRDPKDSSPDRLVVTTVVSSQQLRRIAQELGVRYAETLTGFKWIANRAIEIERTEGARFVFGYEEALGYTAGTVARDKDGIGAAVVMAELAASEKARGRTVLDRLRAIREQFGLFVGRQKSVTYPTLEAPARIASVMSRLRKSPPAVLGGLEVERVWDLEQRTKRRKDGTIEPFEQLPPSEGLVLELAGGGRAAVRPSGTEPKIKLYLEVVETLSPDERVELALDRGNRRLDAIVADLLTASGL